MIFTREFWFSLPLWKRQQWWRETNYGTQAPRTANLDITRLMSIDDRYSTMDGAVTNKQQ